ncbi:MAG: hypothetical protein ACOYLG_08920 [Chitinophagaceae bacterium]|jgi:hypothetical protein
MKKSKVLLILWVCVSFASIQLTAGPLKNKKDSGVKPAFDKGSKTLGIFMGIGRNYDYGFYSNIDQIPAFGLIYDHGIVGNAGPGTVGIGGMLAYKGASYKYANGKYRANWSNYILAVRGTYHLTILKDKNNKFDPYAGVMFGLRINRYEDTYYNQLGYNPYNYGNVNPISGFFVGAKYNFAKRIGAFTELGYDISFFRIGLNFNF